MRMRYTVRPHTFLHISTVHIRSTQRIFWHGTVCIVTWGSIVSSLQPMLCVIDSGLTPKSKVFGNRNWSRLPWSDSGVGAELGGEASGPECQRESDPNVGVGTTLLTTESESFTWLEVMRVANSIFNTRCNKQTAGNLDLHWSRCYRSVVFYIPFNLYWHKMEEAPQFITNYTNKDEALAILDGLGTASMWIWVNSRRFIFLSDIYTCPHPWPVCTFVFLLPD